MIYVTVENVGGGALGTLHWDPKLTGWVGLRLWRRAGDGGWRCLEEEGTPVAASGRGGDAFGVGEVVGGWLGGGANNGCGFWAQEVLLLRTVQVGWEALVDNLGQTLQLLVYHRNLLLDCCQTVVQMVLSSSQVRHDLVHVTLCLKVSYGNWY